jgi:glycosyltransferase involved in cell wall biosynthesis
MNILHLHTGLNLTCGITKTIYLIAKYPAGENKHFVLALNGDAEEKFKQAGIYVKLINSGSGVLKNIIHIRNYIKENNIDIIHSHHRYFDFISYLISFTCKIKRVTSVQSFVYGKKLFSYKSPLLLAAGESVKKHLISYFGIKEDRIKVFNNFVDFDEGLKCRTREDVRMELSVPENIYVVGYIGRFSIKEKGIDILINAFEKFKKKHSDAKSIMVGSGDDIEKVNIPENVIVLNSKQNIFDYYSAFDCIVLPSRIDPFPLTALEAGMMKVPFIGSCVNGISEIIDDISDGLLFKSENSDMLCEKLERFYSDRKFAEECAERFYIKVKEKYSYTKAIEKLNHIYDNL